MGFTPDISQKVREKMVSGVQLGAVVDFGSTHMLRNAA